MSQRPRPATPPSQLWVGSYLLVARIGEGGMGVVHLGQRPDGTRAAVKVLRPNVVGDDESRERLAREVASLRRVKSPRVAEILDADPWGPVPYVATRYVPGPSLHEHVRSHGPIRGDDLRWFGACLAEAVIAVHAVGVLHRDIKPSNVLLEGRSPVLIDFGLARLTDDTRLTSTGWALGTPGYLAPEILHGRDATTASDVHSWAATMVFAATGRAPFGYGPPVAVMDRVRRGEHDLSAVPGDLRPLLTACLDPDPARRPETAAVLAALRRPMQGRGLDAGQQESTMPLSLVRRSGSDPATEVLGVPAPTGVFGVPAPTGVFGVPAPTGVLGEAAPTSMLRPRRTTAVLPRLQSATLVLGLFALVVAGFARAPYLCVLAVAAAALLVRTISWTAEAAGERSHARGTRWYDAVLTALSVPWYLLVAAGGTLVLVLWSVVVAAVVGVAYLLFALPAVPGLLTTGAVLALSLWWGPGSRRLRAPIRRLADTATGTPWVAWLAVAALAVAVALCWYATANTGVDWDPRPGPPWRPGTVLGDVLHFL